MTRMITIMGHECEKRQKGEGEEDRSTPHIYLHIYIHMKTERRGENGNNEESELVHTTPYACMELSQ
jgi:hypothetical protein